jgi:hypothetical protein
MIEDTGMLVSTFVWNLGQRVTSEPGKRSRKQQDGWYVFHDSNIRKEMKRSIFP